jgi:hypothetical protein
VIWGVSKGAIEIVMSVPELTKEFPEIAPRRRDIAPKAFAKLDDTGDKILGQIAKMINQAPSWIVNPRGDRRK